MPKLIVSIDGVVIKEVQLTKDRTTLGRRPYNDVVIDHLAVSGEHAAVLIAGNEVQLEDLNSTNGTYVNSRPIRKQVLRHNDMVEIGKYKIKFLHDAQDGNEERAPVAPAPTAARAEAPTPQRRAFDTVLGADLEAATGPASIRVTSGSAAGREVALVKVVTTIGKPGVAVAAITRRPHGYVVVHVEGAHAPIVNGTTVGTTPVDLKHGDVLQLAGTQMEFLHSL
ncbi:MAG: FHA domain-containing protein [Variovorax paradoxus]|nr:MAG: FHA domain-containing protein [Variovorax paradoxus]PZQ11021.1 MAG: FHA domain-containing protein [Variovorax paradoxus]